MIVEIAEPSRIAEIRRAATDLARADGFEDEDIGRVALMATEASTNILKHTGSGSVVVSRFDDHDGRGVEIIAIDSGKGIADLQKSLADGYSTAGSMGTGLGGLQRMADVFGLFSRPGLGTIVLARVRPRRSQTPASPFQVGAVAAIYPGETISGDGWCVRQSGHRAALMVIDGAGHGPLAAVAAETGINVFRETAWAAAAATAAAVHRGLASTRGAVVAIAECDLSTKIVSYVGIGNISGAMVDGAVTRRMMSHNGTAGHIAPRIRSFDYPFVGLPTIILHSDGLTAKWDIATYPGLSEAHPSVIAAVLFRDFRRGRDDATAVVMRPGKAR